MYSDADGYYHFGTVNGPVVLMHLGKKAPYVSLQTVIEGDGLGGGAPIREYFFDANGDFLKKEDYTDILGVKIPTYLLPIHPGRNLAVVLEVAARNLRLKQMGYNAANELTRRHMARFQNNLEE